MAAAAGSSSPSPAPATGASLQGLRVTNGLDGIVVQDGAETIDFTDIVVAGNTRRGVNVTRQLGSSATSTDLDYTGNASGSGSAAARR